MVRRSKRNRDAGISADDGNAMGLTEAFHPVSADGFTTAMPPVDEGDGSVVGEDIVVDEEGVFEEVDLGDGEVLDDEGLAAGESFPDEAVFEDFRWTPTAPMPQTPTAPMPRPCPTLCPSAW